MKKGKPQIDTYSLVPVLQNVLKKKRQMRVRMCVFTHFLVNIDSLCLLCVCVCVCVYTQVMSNSLQPHGLQPARLLCLWNFPGKNTEMG